jgi:hypothetical protein
MKNKFYFPLMLLTIILISFPSICFSELKTVDGEYCDSYLGSMKDKKELEDFRKTVRRKSIENGLGKLTTSQSAQSGLYLSELDLLSQTLEGQFTYKCVSYVISNYLEKVVVVSHTEKRRKICDKVRITLDPEVTKKYLNQEVCEIKEADLFGTDIWVWDVQKVLIGIMIDNSRVGKTGKTNIGLIIETKIPDIDEYKRQQLENEEENQLFKMTDKDQDTVVDRRHLIKILEEQKLSSSGITDSDTVKMGKLLNLDIIVLRMIYGGSKVTKVLKVDTGEVLLFKTYKTYEETKKEGWISLGYTNDDVEWYYNNNSIMKVSPNISRVWNKLIYPKGWKEKNKDFIQHIKEIKLSKGDYSKLHHRIILYEIDCMKNTWKYMRYVDYSDEGESLLDFEDPFLLGTDRIIPDTILDKLRRKVCE